MSTNVARKRVFRHVPHEGEDGLFRQSWYAVCRSEDLARGALLGRDFLDGRIVVWRGEDGVARAFSAFCPHLGADLAVGAVVGNSLQCAFHHWEFGTEGFCEKTGIGDPAPRNACLFKFPVQEKFGIVWVFNGDAPLFELAELSRPMDRIAYSVAEPFVIRNDPWVVCCNTPDWSHFATVHRFAFSNEGQNESLTFNQFGVDRVFTARLEHGAGPEVKFRVTVCGTNLVLIEGETEGAWFGVAGCLGLPRPGICDFFVVTFADKVDNVTTEKTSEAIEMFAAIAKRMGGEDAPIWDTMHFKPGALTRSDAALATYLDQLRSFPRAHPSADFIN